MVWSGLVWFLTFIEGFMEVELMVTKRDDDNRVNIEQSASGRLEGRVLQLREMQANYFNN